MSLARAIDEASVELAAVESVVGTARQVLDVAAETERVGSRIMARVRTVVIVVVVAAAGLGLAYGVKTVLDRRGAPSPAVAGAPDNGLPDIDA
ncbi:MAG TPA: hypothetical protein VF320_05985 [Acidimicrobiales bacterium]